MFFFLILFRYNFFFIIYLFRRVGFVFNEHARAGIVFAVYISGIFLLYLLHRAETVQIHCGGSFDRLS